ncbi:MAG TPA: hypothetical protein VGE07_25335 [Herpetosiphonaceae bacterium]
MDDRRSSKVRLSRPSAGSRWQHRLALLCVLLAGGLFGTILISAKFDEPPATPTPLPSPRPSPNPTPVGPAPAPIEAGDRLYAASVVYDSAGAPIGGMVAALDPASGRELFVIDAGRDGASWIDIALAPDGATLFVASGLQIGAYRTADGSLIWNEALGRVFTNPTVILDPQTGQPTRGPGLGSQLAIAGLGPPALAVSADSRTLYVVSATKPAAPVRIPANLDRFESMTPTSAVQVYDAATGQNSAVRVNLPLRDGRGSLVSGRAGTLHYAAPDGVLWLIDLDDDEATAKAADASRPATAISLAGGPPAFATLYALDDTGDVSVFDPATGSRQTGLGVGNDKYFSNGWMQARPDGRLVIHQLRPDPSNGAPTTELIKLDPGTARQEGRYPTSRLLAGGLGALSGDGETAYLVDDPTAGGEALIIPYALKGDISPPQPITRRGDIRRLLLGPAVAAGAAAPPIDQPDAGQPVAWLGVGTGDGANIVAVDDAGGEILVGRNVQAALPRAAGPPLLVTASSGSHVALFDPATSRALTVTLAEPSALRPWNFQLSPDGGLLAIKTSDPADGQAATERIIIADLATGTSRSLLSAAEEPMVNASILSAWAGDSLYLTTYASNRTVIWSVDPAGAAPAARQVFVSDQPIAVADFNPGRGLLAYRLEEPGELRLRDLRDGGELVLSGSRRSRPVEAAISPDGAYVAFTRAEGRVQRLMLYDVAAGAEQILSEELLPIVPPIWSGDSQYLLQSAMRPSLPRDPHLLVFRAGRQIDRIALDEAIVAAGVGAAGQIVCLTHDNEYATLNIRRAGVTERVPRTFPLGVSRPRLVHIP